MMSDVSGLRLQRLHKAKPLLQVHVLCASLTERNAISELMLALVSCSRSDTRDGPSCLVSTLHNPVRVVQLAIGGQSEKLTANRQSWFAGHYTTVHKMWVKGTQFSACVCEGHNHVLRTICKTLLPERGDVSLAAPRVPGRGQVIRDMSENQLQRRTHHETAEKEAENVEASASQQVQHL